MNRKTCNEGKHIDQPFREINWWKVDEHRKGVVMVGRFDIKGGGHSLSYNTLCAAKGGERRKRLEILS